MLAGSSWKTEPPPSRSTPCCGFSPARGRRKGSTGAARCSAALQQYSSAALQCSAVCYTDGVQDCVMTLLALEAGLKVPEALLEVAASLETGEHEMQTRCGGAQCYYCVQCAVQVRDLQRGVGGGAGGRGLHRPGGLRLLVRYWKPCFTVYGSAQAMAATSPPPRPAVSSLWATLTGTGVTCSVTRLCLFQSVGAPPVVVPPRPGPARLADRPWYCPALL